MNHKGKKKTKKTSEKLKYAYKNFVFFLPMWFIIILKNFLVDVLKGQFC
jgi:hypothetical protein